MSNPKPKRRWQQTVLAVLTFVPGVLSFWLGALMLYYAILAALFNKAHIDVLVYLVFLSFLLLGVAWIASSVLFRSGRMRVRGLSRSSASCLRLSYSP